MHEELSDRALPNNPWPAIQRQMAWIYLDACHFRSVSCWSATLQSLRAQVTPGVQPSSFSLVHQQLSITSNPHNHSSCIPAVLFLVLVPRLLLLLHAVPPWQPLSCATPPPTWHSAASQALAAQSETWPLLTAWNTRRFSGGSKMHSACVCQQHVCTAIMKLIIT